MNICGIEIPNDATLRIKNWPYGPDISVVARLFIFNNDRYPEIISITELSSDLGEEELLTEEFRIKFTKKKYDQGSMLAEIVPKDDQEDGTFAEIVSGPFKRTLLFLKFKKPI